MMDEDKEFDGAQNFIDKISSLSAGEISHNVKILHSGVIAMRVALAAERERREKTELRMRELEALLSRAKREMIQVGNDLNWDGKVANQSLVDAINEIHGELEGGK